MTLSKNDLSAAALLKEQSKLENEVIKLQAGVKKGLQQLEVLNDNMNLIMLDKLVTPLIHNGIAFHHYAVHKETGIIYTKRARGPKKANGTISRFTPWVPMSTKSLDKYGYPIIGLTGDYEGDVVNNTNYAYKLRYKKGNTFKIMASIHRVVQQTLKPALPCPPDVPAEDWANTPESVKRSQIIKGGWHVNHIDHDKTNFTPDNLEWVSITQNNQAWRKHYGHSN